MGKMGKSDLDSLVGAARYLRKEAEAKKCMAEGNYEEALATMRIHDLYLADLAEEIADAALRKNDVATAIEACIQRTAGSLEQKINQRLFQQRLVPYLQELYASKKYEKVEEAVAIIKEAYKAQIELEFDW